MGIDRTYKKETAYPAKQTGLIAKLMGLSDEGVRMYERHGLVYPEKDKANKYRAFDAMDMIMLLYAKVYRESGFSPKRAQHIANDCDLEDVALAYRESADTLRAHLAHEQMRLRRIEEITAEIEAAHTREGLCEIAQMPGMFRIEYIENRSFDASPEKQIEIRRWMEEFLPFAMLSTKYPRNSLHDPDKQGGIVSGLGMREDYAQFLGISAGQHIGYISPCTAVHAILSADNRHLNPNFSGMLRFIEEQNLQITGDALGLGIVNLHFSKTFERYFHIYIPVQSNHVMK